MAVPDKAIRMQPTFESWQGMSDTEVWSSYQLGSWEALEYIYRIYTKDLFNYGMKIKPNSSLVEDAIQELFVELWSTRRNLSGTLNIKCYLLKALKWKIYYLLKRERKLYTEKSTEDVVPVEVILPYESQLINQQYLTERKTCLYRCVSKLPQRQREILQLLFFENLAYEEVAEIMNIRVRSVYVLASRSLSSLRKEMTQQGAQLFINGLIYWYGLLSCFAC